VNDECAACEGKRSKVCYVIRKPRPAIPKVFGAPSSRPVLCESEMCAVQNAAAGLADVRLSVSGRAVCHLLLASSVLSAMLPAGVGRYRELGRSAIGRSGAEAVWFCSSAGDAGDEDAARTIPENIADGRMAERIHVGCGAAAAPLFLLTGGGDC
jgi:hypothetical protein